MRPTLQLPLGPRALQTDLLENNSWRPYPIVFKKLQDEGDGAGVDAHEQVDAGQRDVGGARDVEHVGHGIHQGSDRPSATQQSQRKRVRVSLMSFYIILKCTRRAEEERLKRAGLTPTCSTFCQKP